MKKVAQEAPMGCAVACVASIVGLSYRQALGLFNNGKRRDHTVGFYNRNIIQALKRVGLEAFAHKVRPGIRSYAIGTIVFISRSYRYPFGHYLVKTKHGWMNPWINFPEITPAKAGYQEHLPGRLQWVIETNDLD